MSTWNGMWKVLMFAAEIGMLLIPILAANQMGYASSWNYPLGRKPISVRWLGKNKTIGAYYAGPLFAVIALGLECLIPVVRQFFAVERLLDVLWRGALIGIGVVLGDQINSFYKRRRGLSSGLASWTDHVDWAVGGGLVALAVVPNVTLLHVLSLVCVAYPIHLVGNRHSFGRGWRKTPH
jgi:hypothetical protein